MQKLRSTKNTRKGYVQYDLQHTPLKLHGIVQFLNKLKVNAGDLIVVPESFKEKIQQNFCGKVISTLDNISKQDLDSYKRLIWASVRVDRGAFIARHFYNSSKTVEVLTNTGPARVWMHDEVKENVLLEEYDAQKLEKIAKFGYGIGADFGNLLQFIDNAKSLDGDFVEIGCFMGSSTCVMANYIEQNKIDKKFFVYDYFNGFTYAEAKSSLDSSWQNMCKTDGRENVEARVQSRLNQKVNNFQIIQRNIIEDDALREVQIISFANIDVDLYEAVYAALVHVHKKLCLNGIIIVEDAGHTPWLIGAKIALEEFLELVGNDSYHTIQMESGQYVLIKR
jgi:hypothetical protein